MHREGTNVRQLFQENNQVAITSENPYTGEKYLALFNIDDENNQDVSVALSDLGITGKVTVTDMWSGEKVCKLAGDVTLTASLAPHACVLYKLK